jgi:hypothetical protein
LLAFSACHDLFSSVGAPHPAPIPCSSAPPSTSRRRGHGVHHGRPKTPRQKGEAYAWVYAGQLSMSP